MEFIEPVWNFADAWQVRILVLLVLLQMVLTIKLYMKMAGQRFKAAKEGRVTVDTFKATQNEPEDLAVYTRAVANQFEAPVMFYALVAMSLALGVTSWITVILAAVFVAFRWFHANEMIGPHNVLTRRKLFLRSLQALILLMGEVAISTLLFA